MAIKFMSFNVNGLNSPYKRSRLWKDVLKSNSDIIYLLETHLATSDTARLRNKFFPHIFHSSLNAKKAGTAILIKNTIAFQLIENIPDPKGRFLILKCLLNSTPYTLVSVYAPNSGQLSFFNTTLKRVQENPYGRLVIAGDFNAVINKHADRSLGCARYALGLQSRIQEENLHDIWRYQHSNERDYTYYSSPRGTYSRIDFFLIDSQSLLAAQKTEIGLITWSDHSPIFLHISPTGNLTSRPLWRLNNFLLKSPTLVTEVKARLLEFFSINKDSVSSPAVLWCAHKAFIRGILLQLNSREKKKRQLALTNLLQELRNADKEAKSNPSPITKSTFLSIQNKLRVFYLQDYNYSLNKLKWNSYLQGDRPGRFLANRVKTIQAKSKIPFLTKGKIHDPRSIANAFAEYYSKLYNLKDDPSLPPVTSDSIQTFLDKVNLPSLSCSQLTALNAPISSEEIVKIIGHLTLRKSPGPDGLTNEYYKIFQSSLVPYLCDTFQNIITTASPPKEMLQAVITTIPKPGKPSDHVTNYRPISLLNCDIKIYSKLIANRVNTVLSSLVHHDQVGFVANRQARDGTRRILNLIQLAKLSSADSILISLDAEKAFDRVNWSYLSQVLNRFGFGGLILNAIQSLYTFPSALVFTSGFISAPFDITNGTRQGCPLSPLIFALCIEPLAAAIRATPDISGLHVGQIEHKIGLYADDIILICTSPSRSLSALLNLLSKFADISYYKLNTTKSVILPMTNVHSQNLVLRSFNFQWADHHIPYLGIQLTRSPSHTIKLNLNNLILQFESETARLSKFPNSWMARINLIKMLLLPKFVYVTRTIPYLFPKHLIAKLQAILHKFIWNGSKPRFKNRYLFPPARSGGLSVPDLASYNIAALLEPAYILWHCSDNSGWAQIENCSTPHHSVKDLLALSLFHPITSTSTLQSVKQLLDTWCKFVVNNNWLHIRKDALPLTMLHSCLPHLSLSLWVTKGITHIHQLYSNGIFRSFLDLVSMFFLPKSYFFQFLQIRHALQTFSWSQPPKLLSKFNRFFLNPLGLRGGISVIYSLLLMEAADACPIYMERWENELSQKFSLEEWATASTVPLRVSKCINHFELMRKIHLRWYLTPVRLAHSSSSPSRLCWRQCGREGTLLHMWWSCPHISLFWEQVSDIIFELTNIPIPLTPELAILDIDKFDIPVQFQTVVHHVLFAARTSIARLWKLPITPALTELINRINLSCHSELILSPFTTNLTKKLTAWTPWTSSKYFK